MYEPVEVCLEMSSYADNVAVVRAALTGIAEVLSFSEELSSDLRTGVSEACNNVSIHAYPDGQAGPMQVTINCLSSGIEATVTDSGKGITRISGGEDRMGLGLAVISALADRSEFRRPQSGGAEVRMWFERPIKTLDRSPGTAQDLHAPPPDLFGQSDGEVVVWCTDSELQRAVLARVLKYMAASAHFSVDGIDGVRDASAAVASHVSRTADDQWVGARITAAPHQLELIVGPLARAGLASQLPVSVEATRTQPLNGHELLHVTIVDRARAA